MFSTFAEADKYVQENKIRQIDLKFIDLWGRWHHVTIAGSEFSEQLMISGVGFDGSSVGFKSVKSSDMVIVPDLATGFLEPFYEVPTLSFISNILEADTKAKYYRDPREIARRAENLLSSSGIADQSIWGPEFEFYIFDEVVFDNGVNVAAYRFESEESNEKSGPEHGFFNPIHGGYHTIPPRDQLFDLRSQMVEILHQIGIPVKYHHHEVGGPGQCEIETPLLPIMLSADASMMIKYVVRMVAFLNKKTATFLPKPLYGEAGNGMHFHQLMLKKGKNLFFDAENKYLLSQTALFYIGGLLTHAPALLALTNPSTNSYRRLVPGFEAPINIFFSSGNRSAAIRVPKYATNPDQVRFEYRPPDATCNPYLAMAAMLMAGIDGINRKIDPTEAGFGPFDDDVFTWPPAERSKIRNLPTSLDQALRALEIDHKFLLTGDVFNEEIIVDWINYKMAEDAAVRSRPHPYEVQMYYDL